jgi:glutathione peroxidase
VLALAGALTSKAQSGPAVAGESKGPVAPALRFEMKDIDGNKVNLGRFQGNVILIVNVASFCGNTPQYASLETLYQKYQAQGFTILAFPANEFGKQEPGSDAEIKQFCSTKYRVTFPIFSKIVVKGEGQAPLYRFLTDKATNPKFGGDIEWNFAKFLVNRKGEVVARFPAGTDPLKAPVVSAIETELAAPRPQK